MTSHPESPLNVVVVHGVDVIDVQDYALLLNQSTKPHLKAKFTEQELTECGDNERTAERLAGRFATKEAVLKALCLAFGDGVAFSDVEVVIAQNGAPTILTHRKVNERAAQLGVEAWLVSTSHTPTVAFASVIGVRSVSGL